MDLSRFNYQIRRLSDNIQRHASTAYEDDNHLVRFDELEKARKKRSSYSWPRQLGAGDLRATLRWRRRDLNRR